MLVRIHNKAALEGIWHDISLPFYSLPKHKSSFALLCSALTAIILASSHTPAYAQRNHSDFAPPTRPKCDCPVFSHRFLPIAEASFKHMSDPSGNDPLGGLCRYDLLLMDEGYCPADGFACYFAKKKKARLASVGVRVAAQCGKDIFAPYRNPFLKPKRRALGPFHRGEQVEVSISDWFSSNAATVSVQDVGFLSVVTDNYGAWIKGTVPIDANVGVLKGSVTVTNDRGAAQLEFSISLMD
jgi:hypothetical protein